MWEYSRFEITLYFTAALKQERNRWKRHAVAVRAGVNADKKQFKKFMDDDGEDRKGKLSSEFVEQLQHLEKLAKTGRIPKRASNNPDRIVRKPSKPPVQE